MIVFILIFSFLFESAFSNIVNINSIFTPLFTLTSLVLIYPYFNNKKINYIIVCFLMGLFYDISFSDSIFVNTISFGLVGNAVMLCYNYVKYNIYTANIINVIILITYRILSYIIVLSVNYVSFNSKVFFMGIYNSLLINIIYGIILYFVLELLAKILNKKIVE